MTHVSYDTQTTKRLRSKPQDALEGVVLSVCGNINTNALFPLISLENKYLLLYNEIHSSAWG